MWEKRPIMLLLLATAAVLVGTFVTMVLPFVWVNTEADAIEAVKPYSAIELEGRDVYIRDGCNNCHSQLIRPLEADVKRYGPYSRSGEFVYDRPHLWGSRRMGPDLARIGGKYPDEWHYNHMADPGAIAPGSNMPSYSFLTDGKVDPPTVKHKMDVLGFPYTDQDISGLADKTEMDAIVAYLQKVGRDFGSTVAPDAGAIIKRESDENPLAGNAEAIAAGNALYQTHCASCHGADRSGDIGPELEAGAYEDGELFDIIAEGIPDSGMPPLSKLGHDKIWKIVGALAGEN